MDKIDKEQVLKLTAKLLIEGLEVERLAGQILKAQQDYGAVAAELLDVLASKEDTPSCYKYQEYLVTIDWEDLESWNHGVDIGPLTVIE
jgi:hypothetical protein